MFKDDVNNLSQMLEIELTKHILPYHLENMRDPRGGFFGTIANDQTIDQQAPKGLVQCARLLWTYARAYRFYQDAAYLQMATVAYDELLDRFQDQTNQGFYWLLTPGEKAGMWKTPYHNGRACLELMQRIGQIGEKNP